MNKLKIAKKRIGGGINKAFTLVELVVVIAIIAILSGVSVAGYFGYVASANKSADNSLVKQLDTLVKIADEDELVNAVEMRSYFAENGITSLNTKNKDNIIVYDINTKSVSLATANFDSYETLDTTTRSKIKRANAFGSEGSAFYINPTPIAPEEIFSGKMILSTGGNALSNFVYNVRNGKIAESISYLNTTYNNVDTTLAESLRNLISSSLFIDTDGTSSAYNIELDTYTKEYSIKGTPAATAIDNVIFSENITTLDSSTFAESYSISNLVIPSSVTSIASDAFKLIIPTGDANDGLAVAFLCSDERVSTLPLIKADLMSNQVTITSAESVTEAMRTGKKAYISGIKRYVHVNTEQELIDAFTIGGKDNFQQGDCVVINDNITLKSPITIPYTGMLLVPTMDKDPGYSGATGFNHNGSGAIPSTNVAYKTLTLDGSGSITIEAKAKLLVNSISGQPSAGHWDQDVNGFYGLIELKNSNNTITVLDGGLLDCFGYIKGSGKVTCQDGGEIRDLYVVKNWRGGSQAIHVFATLYPMNEYDMHNIEVDTVINSGGVLSGNVKMYAADSFYYTVFPQVDNNNGLIRLAQNAVLTKTYTASSDAAFSHGIETYSITGGATFSSSTLPILGYDLSTKDYVYPIDGDIDFNLSNGSYSFDENVKGFKFMPGSTMTLSNNASLTTPKETTVVFYDGSFVDPYINSSVDKDTAYPSNRGNASLVLNTNTSLTANGPFAGAVVINDLTSDTITATINNPSEVSTYEANGRLNNYIAFTFYPSYQDKDLSKIYFDNTINTYNKSGWVNADAAISSYNALVSENFSTVPDSITDETLIATAKEVEDKYNKLKYSGITSAVTAANNTTSTVQKIQNALNPVFTIGTLPYRSLAEAVNNVNDGDIIAMHNDYNYEEATFTFSPDKTYTLDLNGYTFNSSVGLINNSKLTIQNGNIIINTSTENYAIRNKNELSFISCDISYIKSGGGNAAIYNENNATINSFDHSSITTAQGSFIIGIQLTEGSRLEAISNSTINSYNIGISAQDATIGTISNCRFTSSNPSTSSNVINLSNNSQIDKVMDVSIYSQGRNINIDETSRIGELSGTFSGNRSAGIITNLSNNSIKIYKNSYFKNTASTIIFEKNSSSIMTTTELFAFEDNYILDTVPLKDSAHDGYYTTKLGYTVTYIDTFYDESTNQMMKSNSGYYGSEISSTSYSLADPVTILSGVGRIKDSAKKHYVFSKWVTKEGLEVTSIPSINQSYTLYAEYRLTDQNEEYYFGIEKEKYDFDNRIVAYMSAFASTLEEAVVKSNGSNCNIHLVKNYTSNGDIITFVTGSQRINLYLNNHTIQYPETSSYGIELKYSSETIMSCRFTVSGPGKINMNGSSNSKAVIYSLNPQFTSIYFENNPELSITGECTDTYLINIANARMNSIYLNSGTFTSSSKHFKVTSPAYESTINLGNVTLNNPIFDLDKNTIINVQFKCKPTINISQSNTSKVFNYVDDAHNRTALKMGSESSLNFVFETSHTVNTAKAALTNLVDIFGNKLTNPSSDGKTFIYK